MLRNMSRTLPPIFLLVAAFLINLTLSRLVALEREQIGLMKALGYRKHRRRLHYVKFVIVIVAIGILIGSVAGTWLGVYFTELFSEFFRFPFLVFAANSRVLRGGCRAEPRGRSRRRPACGSARSRHCLRRLRCSRRRPPHFRRLLPAGFAVRNLLSQPVVMMMRNITGHPIRAMLTTAGIAFAAGILIASLFLVGTMEALVDVTYFMADRQDASVSFIERRPLSAVDQIARLPGVLAVEPYREVPVRIRNGHLERRVMISGRPRNADLSRIIDIDLHPVELPEGGLAISAWLAQLLDIHVGDVVEVDLLEDRRRTVSLPVTALVEDYFGINGMMNADALARLMREAPAVNRVNVSLDASGLNEFYDAVKRLPTVAGVALQRVSLDNFRKTMAVTVTTMATIYTGLAALIAFGVVYNSARISLSEHARELASLRVLGFTQGEVLRILFLELALLTLLAQPPGWAIGYGLAWLMKTKMAGDVMRAPLLVNHLTYALASGFVIAGAVLSAMMVRQRVVRLNLVTVLKTRD